MLYEATELLSILSHITLSCIRHSGFIVVLCKIHVELRSLFIALRQQFKSFISVFVSFAHNLFNKRC